MNARILLLLLLLFSFSLSPWGRGKKVYCMWGVGKSDVGDEDGILGREKKVKKRRGGGGKLSAYAARR